MNNEYCKRDNQTKSITLELKPVGKTRENIKNDGILEYDTKLQAQSIVLRDGMDIFYRNLLTKIANEIDVNWSDYNKDNLPENEEAIASTIIKMVKKIAKANYSALFNAEFKDKIFPDYLASHRKEFENAAEINIACDTLRGCASLLAKYFTSREHIFTGEGHGSFSQRVIDNFDTFLSNQAVAARFIAEQKDTLLALNEEMNIVSETIFDTDFYKDFISQEGIDNYNKVIGGTYEGETYIKGLNNRINEINNARRGEDGFRAYPYLKPLYKQILTKRDPLFKVPEVVSDEECKALLREIINTAEDKMERVEQLISSVSPENVGIRHESVNSLSKFITGTPTTFKRMRMDELKEENPFTGKTKKEKEAYEKLIDKLYKKNNMSVSMLNGYIDKLKSDDAELKYDSVEEQVDDALSAALSEFKRLHSEISEKNIRIKQDNQLVKDYLDAINLVFSFLRTFKITSFEDADGTFYNTLEELDLERRQFVETYNTIRNYVVKKPMENAVKLSTCFGSVGTYANKWVADDDLVFKKSEQALLRKDGHYYYAIFSNDATTKRIVLNNTSGEYEKLVVNALGDPSKNLPKFFLSNNEIRGQFLNPACEIAERTQNMEEEVLITREFFNKYNAGMHTKGYIKEAEKRAQAHPDKAEEIIAKATAEWRDFLTEYITLAIEFIGKYEYTKKFDYDFRKPEDYEDIGVFHDYLTKCWYKLSIAYASEKDINEAVENGSIYLFEITNRFIRTGTFKDVYSQVLKYIFEEDNLKEPVIKLNSRPSFFYRDAVLDEENTTVHEVGSVLVNRNTIDGKRIPEDIYARIYKVKNGRLDESVLTEEEKIWLNKSVSRVSDKRIVKDARFTREQFVITFSVTTNADVWKRNEKTLNAIAIEEKNKNILSVVRGEKNLLYYVLMDRDKNILEQKSLNIVNGVDYQEKLVAHTKGKKEAQQNWGTQKIVKNIKEGYISAAITQILDVALKNDAFIAIESLSDSFKDSRTEVDYQVFKKFETALKSRMACYYKKDIAPGEPGSITNPIQMLNPGFDGIHNGRLFSIEPSYTSTMCPVTGFVSIFDYKKVNKAAEIREFFKKFDEIKYDGFGFDFKFDYKNFDTKKTIKKSEWTLTSISTKTEWNAQEKTYDIISPTSEIKDVLGDIPYTGGENLVDKIDEIKDINRFFKAFRTICNMSVYGNVEYFVSPVKAEDGVVYDSRDVVGNELPNCKDAVRGYLLGIKAIKNLEKAESGLKLGVKAEEFIANI